MSELELIDIFGDNLKSLMDDRGISQNELARRMRVDKTTVSRYMNKQMLPTVKKLINMCVVLKCSADDLLPMYESIR